MYRFKTAIRAVLLGLSLGPSAASLAQSPAEPAVQAETVLTREQAAAILPATVFFRGQTTTIQGRNAAGVRLAGGRLVLMALVDTGGYSSDVRERYQAYLITEVPLRFGAQVLAPGAYGFGFVANGEMVVMDVGGTQRLAAATERDTTLARPDPLHVAGDPKNPAAFRLYLGRAYVSFAPDRSGRLP